MNPISFVLATSGSLNSSFFSEYGFLIFIVIIVFVRMVRNASGRIFSLRRVFTLPALLLIITFASLVDIPLDYYFYFAALLIVGFIPGIKWGEGASIFYSNNQLMYKRSSIILGLWAASLVARLLIEIAIPGNLDSLIIVEGILSFETSMIIGESDRLLRKYRHITTQPGELNSQ